MLNQYILHLDLKGAPPKLCYLEQLLSYLKDWGVTGLLIEYEDSFPYSGPLSSVLSQKFSYSDADIGRLQQECSSFEMDVIPLVQTFGHLEFVLKHSDFQHLRENAKYPNSVCPSNEESFELICLLLDQVLDLHPEIPAFHIGGDEVWQLGVCARCIEKRKLHSWTTQELFLDHVSRIARYVKSRRPGLRVLVWDDMLRAMGPELMKNFNLDELVEPVLWHYGADNFPRVLDVYSEVFPIIWGATAFKGASGCAQTIPDPTLHINNHKLWLAVLQDQKSKISGSMAGIVLTGWQRYDHYAVLCELLPAAIPCLLLCLRILMTGGFSEDIHLSVSKVLGLSEPMPLIQFPRPIPVVESWTFPGNAVCIGSHWQANLLALFKKLMDSELHKGWFHSYNVDRNFTNPLHVEQLLTEATRLLTEFKELGKFMWDACREVYDDSTASEWLDQHVNLYSRKLTKLTNKMQKHLVAP